MNVYKVLLTINIIFIDHIENEEIDDEINKTLGKLEAGNYANLRLKSKNIDCPLLFQSKVHDLSAPSFMKKPFQYIPGLLKADYTYENRVKLRSWYISENFPKNRKGTKCLSFINDVRK